ncbi:MAG: methylated-DNA--[protein]-cysteine S-methyltransferase [Planctomycetota bacterium]
MRHRRVTTKRFEALFAYSPSGLCYLAVDGSGEALERWCRAHLPGYEVVHDRSLAPDLAADLKAFARGREAAFDVRLDLRGTAFQLEVWRELRRIPRGRTRSYGEVAARIGRPTAVRAVGGANARNPVALVVPSHRVVGGGGLDAFAYAGTLGSADRKREFLELEGALVECE